MAITSVKTGSSFTNLKKYDTFLGPNSAYMPSSFESIATVTGTGQTSVTFSSIPSTYKSLQIRYSINPGGQAGVVLRMRLNSDTANYVNHYLTGYNGSVTSAQFGGNALASSNIGVIPSFPYVGIIDLIDYASTLKNKTTRVFSGTDNNTTTDGAITLASNLWMSTAAVNSVTILFLGSPNATMNSGTTIALYGVK